MRSGRRNAFGEIPDCIRANLSSLDAGIPQRFGGAGKLALFPDLPGGILGQLLPAAPGQVRPFLCGGFHAGQHLVPGGIGRGVGGFFLLTEKGRFLQLGNAFFFGFKPQGFQGGLGNPGGGVQNLGISLWFCFDFFQ